LPELDIETILKDVKALEDVNQDLVVNLMKRIVLVESTNDLLVKALGSSIGLLKEFKNAVPDPEKWQNLLNMLESDLQTVESVQEQRMFKLTCGIVGIP
jgi:hypothetical protein